ncbi:MAG: phosphate acyltransferase PlsX [Clostridiales bacterium]|jgi:glycerol-3-phosphate acyltransferase PlsX|nr:phosphate acyltransferase PlsX [Clostridiales bacterium]
MKIVVDIYGGDNAPDAVLQGCRDALVKDKTLRLILTGKEREILSYLKQNAVDMSRVEVVDAPDVVTNDDVPTQVIRSKPDSSLITALRIMKENPEAAGFVTAGSTGAALTGAALLIGRIKGIQRPALAPVMPTVNRKHAILVDCGANMDCKPEYLHQFAVLGSSYMKAVFNIERPRVALMSVGTEDKKGNELTHAAFKLIKASSLNFVGNMEARDMLSGDYDVIVCDGFIGNVAIKSMEGAIGMTVSILKEEIKARGASKFGYLFMKPTFAALKNRLDYSALGGAAFLGCEKVVIKSHGSSKADSITASIFKAKMMAEAKIVDLVRDELAKELPQEALSL